MSMMVSFVLSFFPRDVLDEILNLIESVSEDFPSYSYTSLERRNQILLNGMPLKNFKSLMNDSSTRFYVTKAWIKQTIH